MISMAVYLIAIYIILKQIPLIFFLIWDSSHGQPYPGLEDMLSLGWVPCTAPDHAVSIPRTLGLGQLQVSDVLMADPMGGLVCGRACACGSLISCV